MMSGIKFSTMNNIGRVANNRQGSQLYLMTVQVNSCSVHMLGGGGCDLHIQCSSPIMHLNHLYVG